MSPKLLKRVERFSDTVDEEEEDQTLKMVLIVLGVVAIIFTPQVNLSSIIDK